MPSPVRKIVFRSSPPNLMIRELVMDSIATVLVIVVVIAWLAHRAGPHHRGPHRRRHRHCF